MKCRGRSLQIGKGDDVTTNETLRAYIDSLRIVDTHEHLQLESDWLKLEEDVLAQWLTHYFPYDMVSAGLRAQVYEGPVKDSSKPLAKRWKMVERYWDAARNTGYGRALDIAARDLYGVPRVDGRTIQELNAKFLEARKAAAAGKSHYKYVLKEKSRIDVSVTYLSGSRPVPKKDRSFFRNVSAMDLYLVPANGLEIEKVGSETGMRIHSLDDWAAAAQKRVEADFAAGAVTLKSALAYERPIYYPRTTYADAEREFNRIFGTPPDAGTLAGESRRVVENHMFHRIMAYADRKGLPCQIHTGIQAGNGNVLSNSNPELLVNLFLEYSNVTFDIFHIAYPWWHVLSALAKNFRNVNIDMCWAHIISPEASVRALIEYLDSVPANKISAFGGDYAFVDGVYGHQFIARENVTRALTAKVADGVFDVDRAKEIARWLFIDNPRRIFRLDAENTRPARSVRAQSLN